MWSMRERERVARPSRRSGRPGLLVMMLTALCLPLLAGIIAAAAVAMAATDAELMQRAKEAVTLAFWIGVRAQEVRRTLGSLERIALAERGRDRIRPPTPRKCGASKGGHDGRPLAPCRS